MEKIQNEHRKKFYEKIEEARSVASQIEKFGFLDQHKLIIISRLCSSIENNELAKLIGTFFNDIKNSEIKKMLPDNEKDSLDNLSKKIEVKKLKI